MGQPQVKKTNPIVRSMQIRNATVDSDSGDLIFEGMFTSFDHVYSIGHNLWTGQEEFEAIDRRAFENADFTNCFFKYNHSEDMMVMASFESGTVSIDIRNDGAYCSMRVPPTTNAKDLYALIERGIIKKMSWAFTIREESYNRDEHLSTVLSVDKVYDISAVPLPANDNTSIEARTGNVTNNEDRFYKRYLEELNLRKKRIQLKYLISKNSN